MNSESWGRLFSREELQAMYDRAQTQQFAERQRQLTEMQADYQRAQAEKIAPGQKSTFVYRARPAADWDARANQPTYRRLHGHFALSDQDRSRIAAKVRILIEIVQSEEFPGCTVQELSEASGMSASWVSRTLTKNGIALPKPARRKRAEQP